MLKSIGSRLLKYGPGWLPTLKIASLQKRAVMQNIYKQNKTTPSNKINSQKDPMQGIYNIANNFLNYK